MTTEVVTEFADGTYRFWLPMPQVTSFERDHGPVFDFWGKLTDAIGIDKEGAFHYIGPSGPPVAALRDFIRLALIGGDQCTVDGEEDGVGATKAKHLVDDYCYPARPLAEAAALAFQIADAAVRGVDLKAEKKSEPVTSEPSPSGAVQ
jgi:hypothetical protein